MNSGIISILLHQYPYQFDAIQVLSTIAFLVDLTLLVIFLPLFILRLAWFRRQAYKELASDLSGISLLACMPIAWLTITSIVALVVSEAHLPTRRRQSYSSFPVCMMGAGAKIPSSLAYTFLPRAEREVTACTVVGNWRTTSSRS